MNKKFVQHGVFLLLFITVAFAPQMAKAMCSSCQSGNGYNAPVIRSEFNFTAALNNNQVDMNWVPYAPDGFNYYKVIRSAVNSNPVYPDDGYIKADSDPDASGYTDYNVPAGTVYYRVCSIASPNRYCSPVITIVNNSASGETDDDSIAPAVLTLSAVMESDGIQLTWTISGQSPDGFKIAISTVNENPTYPVMDGDTYRYITDSGKRSYKEVMLKAGETYHYRICQYFSGECLSYSNSVSVEVPEDYVKPSTKEAITKEPVSAKIVNQFSDVSGHRYASAINYLMDNSIVVGYDDGTFLPDNSINRAEFVKIIVETKYPNLATSAFNNCFFDIKNEWYAAYVCLAKEKNVIDGYPDGSFKPGQYINFAEAAKILSEVFSLEIPEGDTWYEGYVKALQSDNYIPPTIDKLDKPITRAEMAELIWRIKEQVRNQESNELVE